MRLEITTTFAGVTFDDGYTRRNTIKIHGQSADLISLADLRTYKTASARARDINDVQQLPNS